MVASATRVAPFGLFGLLFGLTMAACAGSSSGDIRATDVEATVLSSPHGSATCEGAFVAHDLAHVTSGPGDTASTFDGTGAGLAAGDLDGDGDIDLVIANLSGATSIFENLGTLDFARHELIEGRFRGVAIVDVDGDGDLDPVLTTGIGPPVWFDNTGGGELASRFERRPLDGVRAATYAMAWDDLEGDGDLDLVTGSYNAELTMLRNSPILGSDTGVVLHLNANGTYEVTRLAPSSQALALIATDVDADGQRDIVVGNDLATPDQIFVDNDGGWLAVEPFPRTSYSTMSLDAADLDGDGRDELYSTDMKPMPGTDPSRYREVDEDMAAAPRPDNVQHPENVLLTHNGEQWTATSGDEIIAATGWSWSGLFGDLDNDTRQDLFVVNGMRSDQLFDFLPDARLIESNQAFRATAEGWQPADDWGLADQAGGRGVVQFDADRDGDLDLVVNNLDAPARLFENRLCAGNAVTVAARWPTAANTHALGAQVIVTGDDAPRQVRTLTSSRGYLSAGAPEVHFGLGSATTANIEVRWPDGTTTNVGEVDTGVHLVITRS